MTFEQIKCLTIDDVGDEIIARIQSKNGCDSSIFTEEQMLDELGKYKYDLAKSLLFEEVSNLVGNNCATVEAFPDSMSNYKLWINDSILKSENMDDAFEKLRLIQSKEIEISNRMLAERAAEAAKTANRPILLNKILGEKSPTVAKIHSMLKELAEQLL